MAKKDIASLVNGLVGDNKENTQGDTKQETAATADQNKKNEENNSYLPPKRPVGRPRRPDDSADIRATFIVNAVLLRKLKYIALVECKPIKDAIFEAMELYVTNWEKERDIKIDLPS